MHEPSSLKPAGAWVCLTVLVPAAAEDRVVDWLLTHETWQIEFSVHPVAARGPLVRLAVSDEQVQGFARRVEIKLIVDRAQLEALIAAFEHLLSGVDGGYWVLPIEQFASFATHPVQANATP